jgi:hypothetical protein
MSVKEPIFDKGPVRTTWNRGEIVFAAAAAALAAGVFLPIPALLLDILWVCVLSLTIAMGVIFPAASSTADLRGFSALLSGPALLRIGLVGAIFVRLSGGLSAGLLIPATGRFLTSSWPLTAALACLAMGAVLASALFGACQRIAAASDRYKERIFPLKSVGIETDLKMGVISVQQARTLAEKVHAESNLFSNLTGASLLMRTEGAIEIAAMLGCLIWPFFGAAGAFGSGSERIAQAAAAAVGLTTFSLLPAVISALAGAYLAGKDSLTLRTAPTGQDTSGRTFTLVDQETGQCEDVELLNPDFTGYTRQTQDVTEQEQIAEFEPKEKTPLIETLTFSADSAHSYYRQLAEQVVNASATSRTVVFAAPNVRDLPVTVFVNTAIQLVQDNRKVLLVDADIRRNALAQVFEADAGRLRESILETGFDGLSLYGLSGDASRTKATLDKAAQEYSCVLIYAPDAGAQPELESAIGEAEAAAFMFGVETATQKQQAASAMHSCRQLYVTPKTPMQNGSA